MHLLVAAVPCLSLIWLKIVDRWDRLMHLLLSGVPRLIGLEPIKRRDTLLHLLSMAGDLL